MHKKWLVLLCLTSLSLLADEPVTSCDCAEGPSAGWLNLKHREAGGIGYPDGYSSVDLFYAPYLGKNFYSFIDLRGHLFNNGKWAANGGIGLRYLSDSFVSGLNFFVDWRETKHMHFYQLGAGLELLSPRWDVRLNGYLPQSRTQKNYQTSFDHFEGHTAIIAKKYELALWGADANIGYWLYQRGCFGIHTSLGGYYFRGDFHTHLEGGLFKAKVYVSDGVSLEGQVSWDTHFKWIGQGELAFHLPIGRSVTRRERTICSCCDLIDLEYRISEQVDRFEIPVTVSYNKTGKALNPNTGTPLTFFFVDNLSHSKGTFESPFPTLVQAQNASGPGDVLYIFPGNGLDTGMDLGITLQDNQFLVGSGAPFVVGSPFGLVTIPAQSTLLPNISNRNAMWGGSTVTLANHNLVSGLDIHSYLDFIGIITGSGVEGSVIQNNQLSSLITPLGIGFDGVSGDVIIQNNRIDLTVAASPAMFGLTSILLIDFDGRDCLIQNNTITSETADGGVANIFFVDDFKGRDLITQNNQISSISTGNIMAESDAVAIAILGTFAGRDWVVQNNTLSSTALDAATGIDFSIFNGRDAVASNNTIFSTAFQPIGILTDEFNGRDFVAKNNKITSTSPATTTLIGTSSPATGIGFFAPFTGRDLIANNNTISSTAEINAATGIAFLNPTMMLTGVTFAGRDFIAKNNTISSTSSGFSSAVFAPATGIYFQDLFAGRDFFIQNNTISTIGASKGFSAAGIHFNDDFTGRDCVIQNSNILSIGTSQTAAINFQASFTGRDVILQNSTLSATGNDAAFSLAFTKGFIGRDTIFQNNTISSTSPLDSGCILFYSFVGRDVVFESNSISSTGQAHLLSACISYFNAFRARDVTFKNNTMLAIAEPGSMMSPSAAIGVLFATPDLMMMMPPPRVIRTRDFIVQNNHIQVEGGDSNLGFYIAGDSGLFLPTVPTSWNGDNLVFQRNTISGLTQLRVLKGDCPIEYNQFGSFALYLVEDSPSKVSIASALIRNNSVTEVVNGFAPQPTLIIDAAGTSFDAIIQNNTAPEGSIGIINASTGKSHIRASKNQASAPPSMFTNISFINVSAGILEVESPNLQLSGVQAINQGDVSEMGVTFVPFE